MSPPRPRHIPVQAVLSLLRSKRDLHSSRSLLHPRKANITSAPSKFGVYDLILPSSASSYPSQFTKKRVHIPSTTGLPEYALTGSPTLVSSPSIKRGKELDAMRRSCALAARILEFGGSLVKAGVTTEYIDAQVHDKIVEAGAYPSPLNYMNFPKSICCSINNVVAHGIPDARPLLDGDIINLDVTVYLGSFHGDTSATFLVGNVDEPGRKLVEATRRALELAIAECRPGVAFTKIGATISEFAKAHSYSINQEFCGHGIGRHFHEPPLIYHFDNDEPGIMEEGMTFTIEPMLNQGGFRMEKWRDGWTAVTIDGIVL
ncbi:hypothetical protein SmJEL517_g05702 [Synchytrium microbalum]|uniref:Methionine aminopeptidase n=1 Tax=Synchytrium microbalum TaxID=1806994 RepID=A0A507BMM0_9FUNG|nr:uncharacterized protein SmJEL517_g05702 [Synchytrium microbalum]TPX30847.1 hypothetical protein SmJEL517_g05702 [Synchytrium microbalum]